MTPYRILEVSPDADDSTIKQAYLRKVQESPPDRHPETFKRVRMAYETISDSRKRAKYRLFAIDSVDTDDIAQQLLRHRDFSRITLKDCHDMFIQSLNNFTFPDDSVEGAEPACCNVPKGGVDGR